MESNTGSGVPRGDTVQKGTASVMIGLPLSDLSERRDEVSGRLQMSIAGSVVPGDSGAPSQVAATGEKYNNRTASRSLVRA